MSATSDIADATEAGSAHCVGSKNISVHVRDRSATGQGLERKATVQRLSGVVGRHRGREVRLMGRLRQCSDGRISTSMRYEAKARTAAHRRASLTGTVLIRQAPR